MDYAAKGSALKHSQTQDILPASQYLQDRLQERRARNTRPKRTRQSDIGPRVNAGHDDNDDDLFFAEAEDNRQASTRAYDGSPLAPFAKYGVHVNSSQGSGTLSAGGRKRRTPGARELDEQMDRLTKQNFDLKLELDHRRESQAKLHAEIESMRASVERAERLGDEHEELMRINSLLVEELEKRDKAIQEAADIICELEEKVEDYEERTTTETRPSTAHADSGYAGTETHEQMPPSSPPQVVANSRPLPAATLAPSNPKNTTTSLAPSRPRREPAFLTSQKPSNQALRAVYLDAGKDLHPVSSFNSILSKRASTIDTAALADEVLDSPRLSALSESSFPSIYGKNTPEEHEWEGLPESAAPCGSAHSRQDSISRVNQWIEDRQGLDGTPSKLNRIPSPVAMATMLPTPGLLRKSAESSLVSLSSAAASARLEVLDGHGAARPFPVLGGRSRNAPKTPAASGEPLLLPTPETSGVKRPRSSRSSAAGGCSLLEMTPAPVRSFTPLEPRAGMSHRRTDGPIEVDGAHSTRADNSPATAQPSYSNTHYDDSDSDLEYSDYDDTHSDTLRDLGPAYNEYPDGASITNGTPSRFLKQKHNHAAGTDMFFASASASLSPTPLGLSTPTPQRRKSSAEVHAAASSPSYTPTATKPTLLRAETSPTVYATPASITQYLSTSTSSYNSGGSAGRPSTSSSTASPQSYTSASTTIHFAAPDQNHQHQRPAQRSASPAPVRPAPAPPRSSFTQKTQSLFRRLSSGTASSFNLSMSETAEPPAQQSANKRREREVSPLPTLTSTPSSAYARAERELRAQRELRLERESRAERNGFGSGVGGEIRRPSTSASMMRPGVGSRAGTFTDDEGEGSGAGFWNGSGNGRRGWLRRAGSGRERDIGLRNARR